jgi:hypothetical protein
MSKRSTETWCVLLQQLVSVVVIGESEVGLVSGESCVSPPVGGAEWRIPAALQQGLPGEAFEGAQADLQGAGSSNGSSNGSGGSTGSSSTGSGSTSSNRCRCTNMLSQVTAAHWQQQQQPMPNSSVKGRH